MHFRSSHGSRCSNLQLRVPIPEKRSYALSSRGAAAATAATQYYRMSKISREVNSTLPHCSAVPRFYEIDSETISLSRRTAGYNRNTNAAARTCVLFNNYTEILYIFFTCKTRKEYNVSVLLPLTFFFIVFFLVSFVYGGLGFLFSVRCLKTFALTWWEKN